MKEYPRQATSTGLAKVFGVRGAVEDPFRAVDGISFQVGRGESLGLVGESGCGKSTTSMMLMRLIDPTSGRIVFDGTDLSTIPAKQFARSPWRRRIQMVFQDPTDSLNPRFTAARSIADPLLRMGETVGGTALRGQVEELAQLVGLPAQFLDRFPTSSPAARRPASASPAPSRSSPTSWCWTSRPRRSTSRCRRWC